MARSYSRDKRGRFASKGSGATARGARLKGGGAAGGKAQGRKGGNLDRMDVGRKSSGPKGTVGASKMARAKSVADRKGISTAAARFQLNASKSGRAGARGRAVKKAATDKAVRQKTFSSKAPVSKAKAAYKERSGQAREAANTVAKMKATGKAGKKDLAFFGKKASSAKASLTKLTNSRGAKKSGGKKRKG
jgi:hypothetical protein